MAADEHLSDTQFKHKSVAGNHHAKGKFHGKGHKSHMHKTSVGELAKVHANVTQASAK